METLIMEMKRQTKAEYFRLCMQCRLSWLIRCVNSPTPYMKPIDVLIMRLAIRKKGQS